MEQTAREQHCRRNRQHAPFYGRHCCNQHYHSCESFGTQTQPPAAEIRASSASEGVANSLTHATTYPGHRAEVFCGLPSCGSLLDRCTYNIISGCISKVFGQITHLPRYTAVDLHCSVGGHTTKGPATSEHMRMQGALATTRFSLC